MGRAAHDERITFAQRFICSGVAGILSRTLTSPLEVVKVLQQVGTQEARSGLLQTFAAVYKQEGLKAFWKGNGISCLRLFPYGAVQLAVYNKLLVSQMDPHWPERLSGMGWIIASCGSTLIATVALYPTDLIKTRLTVQHVCPSLATYRGIFHATWTITKREGFMSLFQGITPSLLGIFPFAVGSYLAYSLMDNFSARSNIDLSVTESMFVCGCLAAASAQIMSHPFDTIRKKMQAQSHAIPGGGGVDIKFKGMTDAFVQTVRANGFPGLWRGLTANLFKIVPNAGFMFLIFESSKRVFLYSNGYTMSPFSDDARTDIDQSMDPHEVQAYQSKREV